MTPTYDPTEHEDAREARLRGLLAVEISENEMLIAQRDGAFEYFCMACGQLRLFAKHPEPFTGCGECGNDGKGEHAIVTGEPGTLDKDVLTARRLHGEAAS